MNQAFQEALAARLRWIDVVAFENIEGCEAMVEAALQASYEAVHQLAANDVLMHRYYGPKAPQLLLDVPELADQYELAHEVYTDLTNHKNGSIGKLSAAWMTQAVPMIQPHSKWLAAVSVQLATRIQGSALTVDDVIKGHARILLLTWSEGLSVEEAANEVLETYEENRLWVEEEAHRRHCEDIADTYAFIEAELWAGWREDCADVGMAA
ncbi:hypothetical protein [Pseudomonas sp. NPDC089569]|uniref:hypothetical protein n=1 Tax=Pseudomonas sp. NPDC089569 TaxID=3390722 RepID=UPI003CFD092A